MKTKESIRKSIVFQWFSFGCCYYGPGDRAQKNSPGGLKTKESLLKAWIYVKKSIMLFPYGFYYYSPGDRTQKTSPGGPKTKDSFWKA